jgi:hypothetical protein
MAIGSQAESQTIGVPLKVGSRVTLLTNIDIENNAEGSTAHVSFEDYVAQYVPQTGKLRFENSDIGRAEFIELLHEADGVETLKE